MVKHNERLDVFRYRLMDKHTCYVQNFSQKLWSSFLNLDLGNQTRLSNCWQEGSWGLKKKKNPHTELPWVHDHKEIYLTSATIDEGSTLQIHLRIGDEGIMKQSPSTRNKHAQGSSSDVRYTKFPLLWWVWGSLSLTDGWYSLSEFFHGPKFNWNYGFLLHVFLLGTEDGALTQW